MSGGWNESAGAWISAQGEHGDWSRQHVIDAAMLARIDGRGFRTALDVGCGEGRFSRMLRQRGIAAVGIDPTAALLEQARRRDPGGDYRGGRAEQLEFEDGRFDLVVSYLTLIDIPDFRAALAEMTRVVRPGGSLLIANITSFVSPCVGDGWAKDGSGRHLYFKVDRYLEEFPQWFEWSGIRIENWHRPLRAYMRALLDNGLVLKFFDEPEPADVDPARAALYRRAPWFVVMEWSKPQ
jgi:ubiquinone/menaquinone biosynthesis C-methylase UbiE